MEISQELKSLYSHWPKHTQKPYSSEVELDVDRNIYSDIIQFCNERMAIYEKKNNYISGQLTLDPVLQNYRFCNIYRELDRQTIFYHKLLYPYKDDLDLWFLNMLFCRLVCNTDTITKVGLLNFDKKSNKEVFERLSEHESPKYGNAYIFPISTIQKSKWNTREKFFVYYLPLVIRKISQEIRKFNDLSVVDALSIILPVFKFNLRFHWTEVLIDVSYQYPKYLNLYKEFPIGPGSKPTMTSLNTNKVPEQVCLELVKSIPDNFNYLTFENNRIWLSAENWEGIGCEFRKYTNLKAGKGRIRKY
jgi:hypothetical protein